MDFISNILLGFIVFLFGAPTQAFPIQPIKSELPQTNKASGEKKVEVIKAVSKAAGEKKVEVIKASNREIDETVRQDGETGTVKSLSGDRQTFSSNRETGVVKAPKVEDVDSNRETGVGKTAVGDWKIRIRIEKQV